MRRAQRQELLNCIDSLHEAHEEIKGAIARKDSVSVQNMLSECQDFAVSVGESIEQSEGEGHVTVSYVEEYCETLFHVFEEIQSSDTDRRGADNSAVGQGSMEDTAKKSGMNENKIYKILNKQLIKIENSIKNDIRVRLEIAFFPYKASMWDSLESVYLAARKDPDCDAYCVPIPYYDINPDHSFGQMHYEGGDYPEDIEVIDWRTYNFEERKPDIIYFHNPYDEWNLVTSVHPRYYSYNLKKCTETLVYIPYYATAGGMAEAQKLLPAYLHADYIVIQSPRFREYFDKSIPDGKFLPFGSPKFDKVINKCKNPPAPPEEWAEKMTGKDGSRKRVIFYNTSINGMLANTENFLKKMEYVFRCFVGREDVCLLWRPHPLLESTFDSMRPQYRPIFDALKKYFIESGLGIYDTTPDIEDTIALCDAYIGDAGTSVTSLFGVAGKPIFVLNNRIHSEPDEDSWRGEKIQISYFFNDNDMYFVTVDNQLWVSEENDYHYRFYMDLSDGYSGRNYYMKAFEINGKIYVIPSNAKNLLVIEEDKKRKITLKGECSNSGAFYYYWHNERYIFIIPNKYPYLVRFDMKMESVDYMGGIRDFAVKNVNGEWRFGGVCQYGNELVVASPVDNKFVFIDMETMKTRELSSNTKSNLGSCMIVPDGDELWLLPVNGMTISCWNPKTGSVEEYNDVPDDMPCCEFPFGNIAISRKNKKEIIIISPLLGNMYLSLDRKSGKMEKWETPFGSEICGKNGHFLSGGMGSFITEFPQSGKANKKVWYWPERKLCDINIETRECKEIEIKFDYNEVREHEIGFSKYLEGIQYCLKENAFNSLKDFLDGRITGVSFNKEEQIKEFSKINASSDGDCGKKIHEYVKGKI